MRAGAVWLLTLSMLPLAGAPLLSHRAYRGFPVATRAVLSGLVGAVILSFWMVVWSLSGWRWNTIALLACAMGLAALLRLLLAGEPAGAPEVRARPPDDRLLARASAALIVLSVGAAGAATVAGSATSGDLVLFWGAKAEQFALSRTIDAAFLREPFHFYMQLSYPPLVTDVYALCTMVAGRFAWGAAAMTFPLGIALLAAGLPGALEGAVGRGRAAAWTALTVATISVGGAAALIAGNAEIWLLAFEVMALAVLVRDQGGTAAGALLAGLLLAGASSTKVEGFVFVLVATVASTRWRRLSARTATLLLAPTALSTGAWFLYGLTRKVFSGYGAAGPLLAIDWSRLPEVMRATARVLWSTAYGLPFLVPALALVLAATRSERMRRLLATAAGMSAFFLFTYLHGKEDPYPWIRWSAPRVFLSVAVLLCLAGAFSERGSRRGPA